MMSTKVTRSIALAIALAIPGLAAAAPDWTSTGTITQPDGAFTATKVASVYADSNAEDPFPGDGRFTYVYTLTNDADSFVALTQFQVQVTDIAACPVATHGFLAGTGVEPDDGGQTVGSDVNWLFNTTPINPTETSAKLYITSICGPGDVADTIISATGDGIWDANTTCLGPRVPPEVVGEPMPCTIGFWKNRADGKPGLLQFFPDPGFGNLVTAAVALSGGLFADEADLLTHLGSKGNRPIGVRARQQLSATLLSLAAGDAFPDNQKCKLFEGNSITANACGTGINVGAAVSQALTDAVGDEAAQHDAAECADDINNGIGVAQ